MINTNTITKSLGQRVSDRAKSIAHNRGEDAGRFLDILAREQLIAAVFRADDRGRCALKGGAIVFVDADIAPFARPTRDVNLSLAASNFEELEALLDRAADDAAQFGIEFARAEVRPVHHEGARVRMVATMGATRVTFDVDVEFNGRAVPGMKRRTVPSLLPGMPDLTVLAYPPEATVADKIHAIFRHGIANTRLADYYDLWHLSQLPLDQTVLRQCLCLSFERFGHELPTSSIEMTGLSDDYIEEKATAWIRMLDRNGVSDRAPEDLDDVVERIRTLTDRALGSTPFLDAALRGRRSYDCLPVSR